MAFQFETTRVVELKEKLIRFCEEEVKPANKIIEEFIEEQPKEKRFVIHPKVEELKKQAKKLGLWNLFLHKEYPEGAGLTNLEYAQLAEIMGRYGPLASEVCNCSAPDTGNMETIAKYGTPEQKEKWLVPLLNGEIRSAFLMTEPLVASSDATNISTKITREGDDYVINGRKWWSSGAMDPRCKLLIVMGKTTTTGSVHKQQSMILVPMDTPGVKVLRALSVFGYDDAPEGHAEVLLVNVRVPVSNILLGEGRGFEISQGRLGPGRIHHCMRSIGAAEYAQELLIKRARERSTFGKKIIEHDTVQRDIATNRMEIDQARLLVLNAAAMIDKYGDAKMARREIAMIKVVIPSMACRVIDRALQVHGGGGVSQDFPLARMYAGQRTLRLADGPDEVHIRTIAKLESKAGGRPLQSKM